MIKILPFILVLLFFIDSFVAGSAESVRTPFLNHIMSWLSYLGKGWIQALFCFVLILIGLIIKKDDRVISGGKKGIYAVVVSGILVQIIKHIVGRPRPRLMEEFGFSLGPSIIPGYDAFPSGHATSAFAFAYILSAFFPGMRYPLYGYAILVCISRIYVGAHFPSDVYAGILLGTWTGWVISNKGIEDIKIMVKRFGVPIGIAALSFFIFFYNIGSSGLFDVDEAVYAEASREMIETGDWLTPQYNYSNRYDKPVFFYWLMASSFKAFGITEFAARLWSAIFGVSLTLMLYLLIRRIGHPEWGAIAAIIFATSLEIIILSHASITDMTLTFFISSSLFCFLLGYISQDNRRRTRWWYMGFYLCMALAVLTKGPVGIVLPGAIIFIFLILRGELIQTIGKMHLVPGALLFFVVAAPWYVIEIWINGWEFIDAFFIKHNVTRFTGVVSGHKGAVYYFIPVILLAFFPWSALIPQALYRYFPRSRQNSDAGTRDITVLFSVIWFLIVFIFFSISKTKLPGYIAPLSPALAIMVGRLWYDTIYPDKNAGAAKPGYSFVFMVILSLIIAAGLAIMPSYMASSRAVLKQFNGPLEWGYGLYYISAVMAVAILLFLIALWQKKRIFALGIMAGMVTTISCIIFTFVIPVADRYLQTDLRHISGIASAQMTSDDRLIVYGLNKPSILFYAQRPATILLSREREELTEIMQSSERAYIIARTSRLESLQDYTDMYVVYEKNDYILASNKPAHYK